MAELRLRLRGLLAILILVPITGAGGSTVAMAASDGSPALSHDQWHSVVDVVMADPDTFAGVSADAASGTATVYVTQRAQASPKAVEAIQSIDRIAASPRGIAPVVWSLRFGSGRYSLRELDAAMHKATNDLAWRSLTSPFLELWYVDPALNAVKIGVTQITPAIEDAANNTFGDLVRLAVTGRVSLTDRTSQTDSPPWWGGDGITAVANCSESFPITRNSDSDQGVLTAGHCYVTGTVVGESWTSDICMGKTTTRVNGGNSYDFELVDVLQYCSGSYVTGPAQGYVYYSGSQARPIGGLAHTYVGDQACFDGAVTEENCSGYINNNDMCYTANGITYCHMVQAASNTSTILARPGDSGGPVYEISGSKVYAQGIITATLGSSGGITAYFTPMWRVAQDYGYTLVTCIC